MGILIGMDEAGYGPNYGPLVVAATAWQVPDEGPRFAIQTPPPGEPASAGGGRGPARTALLNPQSEIRNPKSDAPDLYRFLRTVVAKKSSNRRIAIADSKALYAPGLGLRQLERGLHTVLRSMHQSLSCWSELVEYCGADPNGHHKTACWPEGFDHSLPVDSNIEELDRLSARFTRSCESAGVRPLLIRARLIYPAQFNELVAYHGSKGAALSHITVGLLREVIDSLSETSPFGRGQGEGAFARGNSPSPQPSPKGRGSTQSLISDLRPPTSVSAVCDKHGGRNYYAALLQHHFSEHWIEPLQESRSESRYEWGPPEARTCVAFRMNGERFLPTALASMTAKYLRELSMRAFNEFWSARVPNLRPTAGYPNDAPRFRKAIAAAQRELQIDDHLVWRNR
jgi:hypothetical protein